MILGASRYSNMTRGYDGLKKTWRITGCTRLCTKDCCCDFINTPFCIKAIKPISNKDEVNEQETFLSLFSHRRCLFSSSDNTELLTLDSNEQYFFSVSVFYTVLIPQVITKVLDRNGGKLFLKASAWPGISAGLGGCVSAEQWLYESEDLFPCIGEASYYNALLDIVFNFFKDDVRDFLEGNAYNANAAAYQQLTNLSRNKIQEILDEFTAAVQQSKENFKNGEHPIYYIKDGYYV